MSLFLIYVLLWLWDNRSFDAINEANLARELAQQAYLDSDYEKASELYTKLISNFIFIDPLTRVNLAHTTYKSGNYKEAEKHYQLLAKSPSKKVSTIAQIQLGMTSLQQKDTATALVYLKDALKTNPSSEIARYNYEVLKRQFSGKVKDPKVTKQTTQQQNIEKQSSQVNNFAEIQEPNQPKKDLLDKLDRLHLSEEETQAILDAMKINELQYIYQLRRNQYHSTTPAKKEKVEW